MVESESRSKTLYETTVLGQREADVQALREEGLTHQEIADELNLSRSTVGTYAGRIDEKVERARATIEELEEAGYGMDNA